MKQLQQYINAFAALPAPITEAQAELESREALTLSCTDGRDSGGRYACLNELFVQATAEKTGMLYTQKLDGDAMETLRAAAQNARFSAETAPWPMGSAQGSCQLFDDAAPASREQMARRLAKIDRAIAQSGLELRSRQLSLSRYSTGVSVANSRGLRAQSAHTFYELSVQLAAEHNGSAEVGFEVSAQQLEGLDDGQIARTVQRAVQNHLPLTGARSGSYPCVLDQSVVCNILITAWRLFDGRAALEHTTCLWDGQGKQLFSPLLNIVDRVESPYSGYRAALDCEGTRGVDLDLVREGRLCGWMHNFSTAARMGQPPTGNAGRKPMISGAVQTDVVVVPKNLMVLPGRQTTDALIAQMGDGLYISQSFDVFHSINLASGSFSIPCQALVVRQGRPVGRVEGMTLEGSLPALFASAAGVGSEMFTFAMPIIKSFAVSAPALYVPSLRVSV